MMNIVYALEEGNLDINNVEFIGLRAFKNSSLTYLIGIENVKNISDDVFYGTAYLENQKG